ncbi:hypothetical protein VF21_02868 [Pseudogymnoascus sp. 05NY08]|nr:hypothetical protein VF21_02868 [Pseudogymnoascus sp. 05NY08]
MSLLSRYLDDAYNAWMGAVMGCCSARPRDPDRTSIRGFETPRTIIHHHQPQLIPAPSVPLPQSRPHTRSSSQEWITRTRSFASRASSRGSYSLKRKLNMYNGSTTSTKRPFISAPSDFRHVQPSPSPPPHLPRRSFRPLELSIYLPANQLSPILPHFDDECPTPPPQAHTRTVSALSNFSIPRKAVPSYYQRPSYDAEYSSADTTPESLAGSFIHPLRPRPSLPGSLSTQQLLAALDDDEPLNYPPPARLRSNTANTLPILSEQVERVKSVLLEREALDKRIRDVDGLIEERRSTSLKSRPASIYTSSEEPMPHLTTSEIERLRPRTTTPLHSPSSTTSYTSLPPPPLPLLLPRPPLRKKKSFSRVSTWLSGGHSRHLSLDSVTNAPIPVTARDGFYQCVDARLGGGSLSSIGSASGEDLTGPTSWTSVSEVGTLVKGVEGEAERLGLRASRVGVAF